VTVASVSTRPPIDVRAVGLAALIALLSIAFAVLPGAVASISAGAGQLSTGTLAHTLNGAFAHWWSIGEPNLTTDMERVVKFWEVFHVVKATIAGELLAALLCAGVWLLNAYSTAERRARRVAIVTVGILGAPWVALILLVLLANIQGAMSPLSSVMGLLPVSEPSQAVLEVRDQFANGTTTPILSLLIEDFRSYHAAMVGWSAIAAATIGVVVIMAIMHRAHIPRENVRLRRVIAAIATGLASLALFLVLVMLLNLSTVDDTAPALAAFFAGGGL
jgi:hypothetical protein